MKQADSNRTIASIALTVLFLFLGTGCRTYTVYSIKIHPVVNNAGSGVTEIGIGYFDVAGYNSGTGLKNNLGEMIKFALLEKKFQVSSQDELKESLEKAELPVDRPLKPDEILQFNTRYGGKFLLQGSLSQEKTETLTDEYFQVMLNINVFDMKTGNNIASIKVFGKDLSYLSGPQLLKMARLCTEELEEIGIRAEPGRP